MGNLKTAHPVVIDNRLATFPEFLTMPEIKVQAQALSELLHTPVLSDPAKQDILDAELEKQVTRLGFAIGLEVDKRANFNQVEARIEYLFLEMGTDEKTPTENRLSEACREIIAEIRSVGGTFTATEFSKPDELRRLQETVGTYFPSSWIDASEKSGPLAVKASNDRGHYTARETYDSDDIDETIEIYKFSLLEEYGANYLHAKLIEDGDITSSYLAGYPFESKGLPLQVLCHKAREAFNPRKDLMGINGKPIGEGWKYGYVIDEFSTVNLSSKQWYRIKTRPGQYVPTIYVPPVDKTGSTSLYYHEFCHRAEDTVGEKDDHSRTILTRLQEAFLRRRTVDKNDNRDPLINLGVKTSDFEKIELGRPSDFMISYVGKEYIVSYAREVLSVGSEALFENRFGSFHGLGKDNKEDLDHRGFTLGIFATA